MTEPFMLRRLPYNLAPTGRGGHWVWLLPNEAKRLLAAGEVFAPAQGTPEAKLHEEAALDALS